jgi:pimeloyl-ACP methyl ester carboxylesterase
MPSLRLALLAVTLLGLGAAGEAAAAAGFAGCRSDLEHEVECATVPVPLDRTGLVPGSLALHVERIRAEAEPARGVLFVLSGGPGESVSASTDAYAGVLDPALAQNDLVLVDQRGTGLSGALACPEPTAPITSEADADRELAACGASLGAALPLYTTSDVVDDLEDVRRLLGIERIGLFGVSYGTRVALAYAARYPQHVERLVLDSVVPQVDPGAFRLNSFAATSRVLAEVCAPGCPFTRSPGADLAALVRKMATKGDLRGWAAGADGRLHRARIGRLELLDLLLTADYLPRLRTHVPAAVRSALGGDLAPLLRLQELMSSTDGRSARDFSGTLFLATTCAESPEPWAGLPPEERLAAANSFLDSLPPERFAPFDRETALAASDLSFCRSWPSVGRAPVRFAPSLPDVPALVLAGTADLRTPLEDARAVAASLPQAQLVPVRGAGHAVLFGGFDCVDRALSLFLAGRAAGRCPATSAARPARLAPRPRGQVTPVQAVSLTLADVLGQLPLAVYTKTTFDEKAVDYLVRAGGLRGGRYSARLRSLTLERVSVLPGVTVSGRIHGIVDPFKGEILRAHGRLQVTINGSRRGSVDVDGRRLRPAAGAGAHPARPAEAGGVLPIVHRPRQR